jgi:hypothetical protein
MGNIDNLKECRYCPSIRFLTISNNSWREQQHIKGSNHKKVISKLLRRQART